MSLDAKPALSAATAMFDGITIAEHGGLAIASLALRRGRDDAFADAAQTLFGTSMPGPGHAVRGRAYSLFQTGQGQWFVSAPIESHEDIERRLRGAFDDAASVTEQTGGWAIFKASGPRVPAMMERLTMLDTSAMRECDVARTLVDHLSVFIRKTNGFEFWGPRSSAGSLHHALVTAARSTC